MERLDDESCASPMVKTFGFLCGMAPGTVIGDIMAADTVLVRITLDPEGMRLGIMATAAVFLLMTVNTFQAEKVGVFFMMEGDHGSIGHFGCLVDPFFWGFNIGMKPSHDVSGVFLCGGGCR
jgi:hypothetical protein